MKMKRKLFIPLIAALLTVCLTSVGFAAWVITGTTTKTTDAQNFTVYDVDDQRFGFSAIPSNGTVVWGKEGSEDGWLTTNGDHDDEHLKIAIVLAADDGETNHHGKTVLYSVTTAVTDNTANAWKAASDANYVAKPTDKSYKVTYSASGVPTGVTDGSGGALDAEDYVISDSSVTIYVEFDWGSFTGNANPYVFFNSSTYPDADTPWSDTSKHATAGDAAYAMLTAIDALEGVTYKTTVAGTIQ